MSEKLGCLYLLTNGKDTYYGSTSINPRQRYAIHKYNAKFNKMSSSKLFNECEEGEKVEMKIIEKDVPLSELKEKEKQLIKNNDCLNQRVPTRKHKEYYQDRREHILANCKEYKKAYYQKNRERLTAMARERYARKKNLQGNTTEKVQII